MKLLQRISLIVALLPAAPLFAQFDFPPLFGAGPSMGGMSLALADEGSVTSSVTALSRLKSNMVSVALRQDFMTEGMGYAAIAAALPTTAGNWTAAFTHYGNNDYGEQRLSLLYALPAKGPLTAGVGLHYLHSATADLHYTANNLFTFSAAMCYSPSKEFVISLGTYNPIAVKLNNGVRTPALFSLGASYRLLNELLAAAEVEYSLKSYTSLRMGLQYSFLDNYSVRAGFNTQPVIYSFGFGIRWRHILIDVAAQFHNVLGLTPNLTLLYSF